MYPFQMVVKRYWSASTSNDADALTLVLTHGTGFYKESWEPTLDDLFKLVDSEGNRVKIQDVWALDTPTHGDSFALNAKALEWGYEDVCEQSF
jgi:pimeloyl-ACP methyl ester carboxylesterase